MICVWTFTFVKVTAWEQAHEVGDPIDTSYIYSHKISQATIHPCTSCNNLHSCETVWRSSLYFYFIISYIPSYFDLYLLIFSVSILPIVEYLVCLYTLLVSVLRCWETSQEIARVTLVYIHGEYFYILHTVFSLDIIDYQECFK